MEKASTPRSRLTRSSAKQVNTPSKTTDDHDDKMDRSSADDLKSSSRKSRLKSKTESKPKSNGDTSASLDTKSQINPSLEEVNDVVSLDGCESEDSNLSTNNGKSPRMNNHNTPSPTISRKSLRTRRSITPGPELESSASKRLKRSTSEEKLRCTPTNRRSVRAKSESKDFVFNERGKESPIIDSKKYNKHLNFRVIEKIDEINEREDCNEEEIKVQEPLPVLSNSIEDPDKSHEDSLKVEKNVDEAEHNTDELGNNNVEPRNTVDDSQDMPVQITEKCNEVHSPSVSEESCPQSKKEKLDELQIINQEPIIQDLSCGQNNPPIDAESIINNIDSVTVNKKSCTEDQQTLNTDNVQNESGICESKQSSTDEASKEVQNTVESEQLDLSVVSDEQDEASKQIQNTVESEQLELSVVSDEHPPETVIDMDYNMGNNESQENVNLNKSPIDDSEGKEILYVTEECPQTSMFKNVEHNSTCVNEDNVAYDVSHKVKSDTEQHSIVESNDQRSNSSQNNINLVDNDETCKLDSKSNDESVLICDSDSADEFDDRPIENDEVDFNTDNIENTHTLSPHYESTNKDKSAISNQFGTYDSGGVEVRDATNHSISQGKESVHKTIDDNIVKVGEQYMESVQVMVNENSAENIENAKQVNEDIHEGIVIEEIHGNLPTEVLKEAYEDNTIKESKPYNIQNDNLELVVENEDSDEILFRSSINPELQENDPFKEEQPVDNILIKESQRLEEMNDYREEQIIESKDEVELIKCYGDDGIPINESLENENAQKLFKTTEEVKLSLHHSDENYEDDNFEAQVSDKYEGSSSSNSDIYKNMSDFGSDDGKKDQYDDNGFTDSEEYESTPDEEEEPEEDNKNVDDDLNNINQENVPFNNQNITEKDIKSIDLNEQKVGEKISETNTPMTYDKALAILNKNRVKKIDDEEFFDMFTQELNRVSDQGSGSDSDIAIVDEYLLEPEEPKKPNKKPLITIKMPQRPPPTPGPQQNQPPDNFQRAYNQQIFPQHNHSVMQRMNYPHAGMYHSIRGPPIYDQFGPTPTSMPDQRLFNPNLPPPASFSQSGMYSHHALGSVSDTQMHYTNSPALKVRNVSSMNSQCYDQNYLNQGPSTSAYEMNSNMNATEYEENSGFRKTAETMTETDNKLYYGPSSSNMGDYNAEGSTPILEMLGLDKDKLKLLKQLLGLKQSKLKTQKKKIMDYLKNPSKMTLKKKILPRNDARENRHKSKKKRQRTMAKKSVHYYKEKHSNDPEFNTASTSYKFEDYNSEHSSEKSEVKQCSSEDELDVERREVSLDGGVMCISLNSKRWQRKRRHRVPRTAEDNDNVKGNNSWSRKHKRVKTEEKSYASSLDSSIESPEDLYTKQTHKLRKMVQRKKTTKETSTSLKNACGTFTVDKTEPLTTSQSESDVVSQDESLMEDMNRSLKSEIISGKNKLSNIFSLQSNQFHHQKKRGLKRKMKEVSSGSEEELKKSRSRKMKRLPSNILEQLDEGGVESKRHLVVISEEEENSPQPMKTRKRRKRVKVKSSAAEESYIPLVTSGATQFGLSRLDKEGILTAAEKAAKFRTDHLYGNTVKRITIAELVNMKKKQKRNEAAAKKRSFKKE